MADQLPAELSNLLAATHQPEREAAWAAFTNLHSRLLLHVARSVGRDYDAAMDAFAYLLEQLSADDYRRLRAYAADGRSKFTTWLVVVARRLCLDHHRRRYGRLRGEHAEAKRQTRKRLSDLVAEDLGPTHSIASDPAPDATLEQRELLAALEAAIASLTPPDRLLLSLRYEDDLSAREISRMMRFPTPFHVYRRINQALAQVRTALARRGIGKDHAS